MPRIEVDTNSPAIVEAQYDVYCWAQDTAVDSAGHPRVNSMAPTYVHAAVSNTVSPTGGKTANVWVKDTTPPTMLFVSTEALAEDTIRVTLQLDEPGTVWCQPVLPSGSGSILESDLTISNYETYIKGNTGRGTQFQTFIPVAYRNYNVDVTKIEDAAPPTTASSLLAEVVYQVYCVAEDDWSYATGGSTENFVSAGSNNLAPFNGNSSVVASKTSMGQVRVLWHSFFRRVWTGVCRVALQFELHVSLNLIGTQIFSDLSIRVFCEAVLTTISVLHVPYRRKVTFSISHADAVLTAT